MKILVIGNGAREHSIGWKLRESPRVDRVFAAPGNAGTAQLGENFPIIASDMVALAEAVRSHRVDLTVVGPEAPLALGIVDRFRESGLAIIGPKVTADKAHDILEAAVAPDQVFQFHLAFITHGRQVCKAQRPRCPECVVADGCPSRDQFVADAQAPALASPNDRKRTKVPMPHSVSAQEIKT